MQHCLQLYLRFFASSLLLAFCLSGTAFAEEAASALPGGRTSVILAPHQHATLSTEVPSSVVGIEMEMGQGFEEGAALIILDSTVYVANRDKARAQVRSSGAQLQAKENLLVDGGVSVAEVETARMNLAVARTNLVLAEKQLDACTIKAPYSGGVVKVHVNKYEGVQAGQELIEIVDDSILRAQFLIPSTSLGRIKIGQRVEVTTEGGKAVDGKISHVGRVVDPASGTVKVFAEVQNNGELRGGMRGDLRMADVPSVPNKE